MDDVSGVLCVFVRVFVRVCVCSFVCICARARIHMHACLCARTRLSFGVISRLRLQCSHKSNHILAETDRAPGKNSYDKTQRNFGKKLSEKAKFKL